MKVFIRSLGIFSLACALLGCGVADRVGNRVSDSWVGELVTNQERVRVTVDGDEWLNPSVDGEPLSVVVRIYQLAEQGAFVGASPAQLWSDSEAVLGRGLISQREITVLPGQQKVDVAALDPAVQYVGVAAFFRNTFNSQWHVVFDANELRKDGLLGASEGVRLNLVDDSIRIEEGADFLSLAAD